MLYRGPHAQHKVSTSRLMNNNFTLNGDHREKESKKKKGSHLHQN